MSHLLTVTRESQKLAYNPPIKMVVDRKDKYTIEGAAVLQIPLSPGSHTLEFSAVLRKKSMIIQPTEDMFLTVRWDYFTGSVEVEVRGAADKTDAVGTKTVPLDKNRAGSWKESVSSAGKSLKGVWNGIKEEALKARQDAAVRAAYKEEEEKRKPRTEKVEHSRELTQVEQQSIDAAEMEISKLYQDYLANKMALGEYWSRSAPFHKKIQEIKSRAIWYEIIEHPPEIDPSIPISIDEEAIRNRVK